MEIAISFVAGILVGQILISLGLLQLVRWLEKRDGQEPFALCSHDPNTCMVGYCDFPKCNQKGSI